MTKIVERLNDRGEKSSAEETIIIAPCWIRCLAQLIHRCVQECLWIEHLRVLGYCEGPDAACGPAERLLYCGVVPEDAKAPKLVINIHDAVEKLGAVARRPGFVHQSLWRTVCFKHLIKALEAHPHPPAQ